MANPDRRSIDQLRSDFTIDDRWTESKLIAAGYTYTGDGRCRDCRDPICFYVKEPVTAKGRKHWLVLNEGVLDPHRCQGR